MTVCIGAICDDGKAIVVAADRMMTYGPPMNLQVEAAVRKIIPLSDSVVMLFSGSVPDGEAIATGTKAKMASGPAKLPQVAAWAATVYQDLKRKRVEDTILRPLMGIEFAQFQQLVAQSASSQVLTQMLGMIAQQNLNLDVMLAGIDDGVGHLAIVTHPGMSLPMDTVGTSAIGSGGMHASVRLSLGRQTKEIKIPETIFSVYEAKRASEVAPGVGKFTDMAVLNDEGVTFVADAVFKALDSIERQKPPLTAAELKKLSDACGGAFHEPAK
jgi:20S proteasome alpha/beta subunit